MHSNFCCWNPRVVAVAGMLLCLLTPTWARAVVTEQVLHSFRSHKDGATPEGGLIADQNGNLYGTTKEGGKGKACSGCGTVFRVSPDGGGKSLYAFEGGSDGIAPTGSLSIDDNGNMYGTTTSGGGTGCNGFGCGTVFKFAPDGTETVLYAFQGQADGLFPLSGVVGDANGNLFGTTAHGGNYSGSECSQQGCGTIFEIEPDGAKLTLYTFQGAGDGAVPAGGVILDSSGNLYGTAEGGGGNQNCEGGCGTVFRLAPDGTYSVLYAFQGGSDGMYPQAGLIADASGNLYGTTKDGGDTVACTTIGCGTVFKVSPTGEEIVLYAFHRGRDGSNPEAGLAIDANGNLYGTTWLGGGKSKGCKKLSRDGCGTVFKLTPEGKETVLYSFSTKQGELPLAPVILGTNGAIYGTTSAGGAHKKGVIFELNQ